MRLSFLHEIGSKTMQSGIVFPPLIDELQTAICDPLAESRYAESALQG